MSGLTQRELESYLWGAATLLRGLIDASDYKQYIFPLLFFSDLVADITPTQCRYGTDMHHFSDTVFQCLVDEIGGTFHIGLYQSLSVRLIE